MSETETLKDAKGRSIVIRELTVLEQTRLLRAIGPLQASNQPYCGIVECAAMVIEVDGVPIPKPTSERMIDSAIERVGDEGIAAVMAYRLRKIAATQAAAEQAMTEGSAAASPLEPSAPS